MTETDTSAEAVERLARALRPVVGQHEDVRRDAAATLRAPLAEREAQCAREAAARRKGIEAAAAHLESCIPSDSITSEGHTARQCLHIGVAAIRALLPVADRVGRGTTTHGRRVAAMPDAVRIADDELRQIAATGDPVAALHRDITRKAVRLHIPLRDPVQIRDVSRALRVLASTLEAESASKDDAWRILYRARTAVEMTNRLIGGRRGK